MGITTEVKRRMIRGFQRAAGSLRNQGLKTTIVKPYIILNDYLYDFRYKLDTTRWARFKEMGLDSNGIKGNRPYQPTRVLPLRKLFEQIRSHIPAGSVLLDIGCGKARVLLVAAELNFVSVRGVEFARELCEIAIENCKQYKNITRSKVDFEIVEADAAEYNINSDENVFFLFNPFDDSILSKVLANISTSLRANPRKALLICNNLRYPELINHSQDFRKKLDFNYHGHQFNMYSNH